MPHAPILAPLDGAQPFASAEAAWFWTSRAIAARRDGARIRAANIVALY